MADKNYAAIAQMYGGSQGGDDSVDYDAIAKQYGGHVIEEYDPVSGRMTKRIASTPEWQKWLMTAAQGPSLGFADEMAGIVSGTVNAASGGNFRDNYIDSRNYYRGVVDDTIEDHKIGGNLAQVAASGPIGFSKKAVTTIGGKAAPYIDGAVKGMGFGAAQGAGDAKELSDIPANVGVSALTGGVLAPATQLGINGGKGVFNYVASTFNPKSADDAAYRRVAEALDADEVSTDRLVARSGTLGPDSYLYQAGGQNARTSADLMASMPGKTQEVVRREAHNNAVQRGQRLINQAEDSLGVDGKRVVPELQALQAKKLAEASPIYAQLNPVKIPTSPALQLLLERPVMRRAIEQAKRNAENANEKFPDFANGEQLTMAQWDAMKRGLDDVVFAIKRGDSNAVKDTVAAAAKTRRELLDELDRITFGQYKQARDAWSGPTAMQDAMEEGQKVWAMNPRAIQATISKMSDSEREAWRIGAFEGVRDKLGRQSGQTELMRFWKEPANQEKLKAIFPDLRSYREFARALLREGKIKDIETLGQGSQTAKRQFAEADTSARTMADMADVASLSAGNPVGGATTALRLYGKATTPQPVRDKMGQILLTKQPDVAQQAALIKQYLKELEYSRNRAATASGLLSSQFIPEW